MNGKMFTVLLVEDNPGDTRLIREYLGGSSIYGFKIDHVRSMADALSALEEREFDAVLLDLGLPDSQGIDTFYTLRDYKPGVPILILTGLKHEDTALEAMQAGAQDYLVKDYIDERALPRAVRYAVERSHTAQELQASERKYRQLAETAQDYIVIHDLEGKIIYINRAGLTFSGYEEEEILHHPVADFVPPDQRDAFLKRREKREKGDHQRHLYQTEFVNKAGERVPVEVSSSPIVSDGKVESVLLVARDVRERVKAERALRESEEKFRSLVDQAAEMLFLHDLNGNLIEVNRAAIDNTGYRREELESMSVFDIDPDARGREDRRKFWQSLKVGGDPVTFEGRHKRKNGSVYFAEVTISKVSLQKGEYILALARDITERKEAQEKIKKSELRYRTIFNAIPVAIWEEDFSAVEQALDDLESRGVTDFRAYMDQHPEFVSRAVQKIEIKDVNAETLTMFGAGSKEELLGSLDKITTPRTRKFMRDLILAIHRGETYFEGETVNRTLQGEDINVWLTMRIPPQTAKMEEVLISMMDITERKQAEKKYRNLYNSIRDAILIADTDREIVDCNPAFREIFGYELEEIQGKQTEFVYENHEQYLEMGREIEKHDSEENFFFTVNYRKKSGEIFPGETNVFYLKDEFGETVAFVGLIRDVTERLKAKRELAEREKKFRAIFNNANDAIYLYKLTEEGVPGMFLEVNEVATEMLGYTREEFSKMDPQTIIAPGSVAEGPEIMQALRKESKSTFEMRHVTKEGAKVPVEVSSHLFVLNGDRVVLSIARDISERKQAEQALKEREEKYRRFFQTSQDCVFITSKDGRWLEMNQAAVDLFGYESKEELAEVNVRDLYADPARRKLHIREIERKGFSKDFPVDLRKKDGSLIHTRISSTLYYQAGEHIGYQGTIRDITELVRYIEEIKRQSDQLNALREVGLDLVSELDVDELLEDTVRYAMDLVDGEGGCFYLMSSERDRLEMRVQKGYPSQPAETAIQRGEGLVGQVWARGEKILIENYASWEGHAHQWVDHLGNRALIGVPVKWGDELLGVLEIIREAEEPFSEENAWLLELFTNQAAAAIRNARLYDHAEQRLSRLQSLREIDQTISGSLDLTTTLNVLIDRLIQNLDIDAGAILLYQPAMHTLEFATGSGFRSDALRQTNLRIGEGQAGRAVLKREIVHIPDLTLETVRFERAKLIRQEEFVAYYGVPLIAKGEIVGVLEVFHRSPLDPPTEWVDFLKTLAGQAAIAIDRLHLFNDLERSNMDLVRAYNEVIEGWARALELRDQETEGHSRRVEKLTLTIARRMGVTGAELAHIRQGTLLHDIGKMGVPDQILHKPGSLTEEEWEVMRKHPTFAHKLLSPIEHLEPALDIPYCHHERWDGSGYPQGLKGEEIPLAARIFAIVDVWDALRSDRPYREAWPDEEALAHIKEQSGKHFDPQVVKVFLDVISSRLQFQP